MQRRDVLRATGGGLTLSATGWATALSSVGGAAARPQTQYAPFGSVTLPKAKEAVVTEDGQTVFAAVTDGFAAVDVSDPAKPEVVYENRSPLADHEDGPLEHIFDVRLDGDLLAVAGPANAAGASVLKGVAVYDVAEPTAPERVSFHETDFFNHNIHINDGVVYLGANGSDGPNALVTVDAATGEELGRWAITSVNETWREVPGYLWVLHDMWAQDGIAYLAHWDGGTWMVDVSDPASMTLIAKVRGRDPEVFLEMSSEQMRNEYTEPPGNDHFVMPNDDGTVLGIGVESWDVEPLDPVAGPGGIHLYDITDPANAEQLSFVEPPPTPDPTFDGVWTTSHNFEFHGDRLYTSWYRGGVKVFDVADPTNPRELVHWQDRETTSFWTTRRASDDFFIGSSRKNPSIEPIADQQTGAAIYTFPAPTSATVTETPTATPTSSPALSPETSHLDGGSPSPDGNSTDGTGTRSNSPGTTTSDDGPGFGVLGALGGLATVGLGAWRSVRRNGDGDGDSHRERRE